MSFSKRKRSPPRAGVAAVEFAVIAPVMILFTFGLIEISRITMVKHATIHATREGARAAAHPTADEQTVLARINSELMPYSLDNAVVEFDPASPELIEPGELITVRVSVNLSEVSWVPGAFDFEVTDIVAETTMRRESTW